MPNTSTLTGLTPGTSYALDAVHVDSSGNVSAVVSSSAFTTDAAASATLPDFIGQQVFAGSAGSAGVYTWSNTTLGVGQIYIGVGIASGTSDTSISSLTVNGVSATSIRESASSSRALAAFYSVDCGVSQGDIVLTLNANASEGLVIYKWGPGTSTTVIASGANSGFSLTAPWSEAVNVNTVAGGRVLSIAQTRGTSGGTAQLDTQTGVSAISGTFVDVEGADYAGAFSAAVVSAETPRSVAVGSTTMNANRAAVVAISLGLE